MRIAQVALLTLVLSGAAFATGLSKTQSQLFMKLDTNQDGYITSSEAKSDEDLVKVFKDLDSDENGALDAVEFVAYNGK